MIVEMAFTSGKCVLCTEPTKRNDGMYRGKDEKGNYSGPLYTCDNINCNINNERRKLQKQITFLEEKKQQNDKKAQAPKENRKKHARTKR